MHIGIPAETRSGETRAAATPETTKKLLTGGLNTVLVQSGAGLAASISDAEFAAAGAQIVPGAAEAYAADLVLKVRSPQNGELSLLKPGQTVVGMLNRFDTDHLDLLAK